MIGLGIYAAFLYAAILLFNVTLTLPGFAGMILTLGVAADANIVIFERVKEEFRAGKSVRAAIAAGYGKGFATIVDANVVTAITAMVLFLVATAGVKGFALMLLIGTVMSLLTAVAATRAILGLLAGFNWFDNPKLMGAEGEPPKWIRRDFVGLRNLLVRDLGHRPRRVRSRDRDPGPQPRHRLRGRHEGHVHDASSPSRSKTCASEAANSGRGRRADPRPRRRYGRATATATSRSDRGAHAGRADAVDRGARARRSRRESNVQTVSASFGRQIAEGAILAVIVSLLLITIYIALRFQPKFAGPVMVALLHDVVITVGIYALLGREVTTATVAAVLTVLGYSIYDTIIILDRVRENIPLMQRASFRTLANVSLWETIPRSLATTFITLLPITALYLFGGETLKDFAFALLVGIGAGAYSSIFIAAPLLAVLKEREPEYARKRDDGLARRGRLGRRPAEGRGAARCGPADARPDPGRAPGRRRLAGAGDRAGRRERRAVEARPAPSAPQHPPSWPRQIAAAPLRSASWPTRWRPSCAPGSRSSASCRRTRGSGSPTSSGSSAARKSSRSSSGSPSSSTG